MKAMETIQDLIEEAKVRMVWWCLCIFCVTYILSHTSSSMWMNLPISILFVSGLRILCNEVEFSWKVRRSVRRPSYLSHLEKKQLSLNDSRLSSTPPPPKWKRKIDSPVVEAAISDFIDQILKDFVVDLWYSEITPDREAPELMRSVIMDALGEISGRAKEINLIDLLTRDIVDLIGDHLDLFRRNQAAIGADVMATLSTEERDERLKHHLIASKELHPALISPESEYKVLQQLVGGVLAIVLRPREAQCPLVWTIAREIVTCLVMQPLINLASPAYINEVLELILLAIKDDSSKDAGGDHPAGSVNNVDFTSRKNPSLNNQGTDKTVAKIDDHIETYLDYNSHQQEPMQPHPAEWARILEVATQRRTEVLTPENLENMWAKGRNYKKKENRNVKAGAQKSMAKSSVTNTAMNLRKDMPIHSNMLSTKMEEKALVHLTLGLSLDTLTSHENRDGSQFTQHGSQELSFEGSRVGGEWENAGNLTLNENKGGIKRSNSTSALKALPDKKKAFTGDCGGSIISEFYSPESHRSADHAVKKVSDIILRGEGPYSPKLKCRVIGAYFEKLGSNSFAVYSIAVTDSENRTWFVKRRYRNFERLHKHLKEIPNYTLHLPPKRIFSSSTEDAFVHQRCIQLDKYLQDLLSIANVAEQHEVWDFLSASSKNYSFGKSSSVMRTLAVNVDGAVDDIVRQFKEVSDGFMRKVVGSTSPFDETDSSIYSKNMSWHSDDVSKHVLRQDTLEPANSFSDTEESHNQENQDHKGVGSTAKANGWHSDNELNAKDFPPRVIKWGDESQTLGLDKKHVLEEKSKRINHGGFSVENSAVGSSHLDDPVGMPPEWTPSNVSLPLLNLVDKVFQLKRRGWLRRQVFWISKQILQLIMEDAIDDWLLTQIYWIRSEDTVALGIRWVQDILWPDGIFFTRTRGAQSKADDDQPNPIPFQINQLGGSKVSNKGSFEEQLEAARRASDIKKMLFDGAPTTLVSLIGNKQYKRCARDIFYFTQSTICVKQLTYGILELLVLSVFPELRDLLLGLNEKMRAPPA
ncbi:PX SERINE/THREONINE KINASE PXK [Salix viminalis]|uniref:PX SERINE/THREONINE KINASE PXK n=1 Tax=Salix viminalis TaxID=40686 RepID=A0A9Q0SBX1_SALVM|nr:PX SERINE/THREONINE KINASE PXK [Salix viminalis]